MPPYTIEHYNSEAVAANMLPLPETLPARYTGLTKRMVVVEPNLGEPHTWAFGGGLFALRLKGAEDIARVFYGALAGRRIRDAAQLHQKVRQDAFAPPPAGRETFEGNPT